MKILVDKEFDTRQDLDQYIRTTFGDNAETNKEVSLEMDQDTLQKLQLSDKSTIYGVKVRKI